MMKKKRRRKIIITTTVMTIQSQKLSLKVVLIPILMVTPVLRSRVMTLKKVLMMILEELEVAQTSLLFILKNGENNSIALHFEF